MFYVTCTVLGVMIAAGWYLTLALAGRSTFPDPERLRLREWRVHDVRYNARRGRTEITTLHCQRRV